MYKIVLMLAIIALCSCGQPAHKNGDQARLFDNNTELKTFPVQGGWSYSIDVNGKKFIQQETVPVMQGQHPFTTRAHAEKVGAWVATHIRHNEKFNLTLPVLQSLIGPANVQE